MANRDQPKLSGVVPIVPTPFTAADEIDYAGLAACVEFAVRSGLAAVCLPAYASEFYKLTDDERLRAVETAVTAAAGRIAVVAQANHFATRAAVALAQRYEALGADLISFALPRLFPLSENDLLAHAAAICNAVEIDVLIQDFHPGGATVGGAFAARLIDRAPNFRYLKLEEPMMGPKVEALHEATSGRVGVLEGWGGMYLLELVDSPLCGVMPNLGLADLLARVWALAHEDRRIEALEIFQVLLPQIVLALQNLELCVQLDKQLLAARGILPATSAHARRATLTLDEATLAHGQWLNEQIVSLARRLGLDAPPA